MVSFWLFDGASEDSAREMETLLTQPPPDAIIEDDDPLWSADAENEMFTRMMGNS